MPTKPLDKKTEEEIEDEEFWENEDEKYYAEHPELERPEEDEEGEIEEENEEKGYPIEEETARLRLENEKRKSSLISALWEKLEKEEDAEEKQDEQATKELEETRKLKEKLIEESQLSQFWQTVLSNKEYQQLLKTYFQIVYGMTNKMCVKTIITISESNGQMNFSYEYLDKYGKPVLTEFSKVEG